MSVTVHFSCGSCDAEADGTKWLESKWTSVTGSWGYYVDTTPQDVAPEGWVAFDPYTKCCYCPKCWEEILSPDVKTEQATS